MTCVATKAGQVLSEGQILLDQLLLPVKDAKGQDVTPADRKQQVSQVDDTVTAVQQRKVRCDELSEVRRLKLQQLLQLRTCERDIEQVCQPVDSISHKRSNSTCHFHCLAGNSTIIFFQQSSLFQFANTNFIISRSSTVRGVMFICRVASLITCMQFRLIMKEYLTSRYKFCTKW